MPSETSCTSSRGVMDVCGFLGGDRGGEGVGGNGGVEGPDGGLDGGLPAPWGFLHGGVDACPIGMGGRAGGRNLHVGGASGSWMGLHRVGWVGGALGSIGAAGPLVLEGRAGLRHRCGGCSGGGRGAGEAGKGVLVASC